MKQKNCKILLLMIGILAGAMTLSGCTSQEQQGTSVTDGQNAASGTGQNGTDPAASDTKQNPSGTQDQVQEPAGTPDQVQEPSGTSENQKQDVPEASGNDQAFGQEAQTADQWSGTYVSDSESVTVTMPDQNTISFAFAQAGISGTAKIEQGQAVFHGDDYHVVVFSLNGTVLNVAVSSEEDFDAADSPLNGTYIRSAD